ncbi:MAG: hypothetical protein QOJ02_660 [Acidobacteriota bacterium]|nr:hypothetical protein [Acidobacteriota bacterium]
MSAKQSLHKFQAEVILSSTFHINIQPQLFVSHMKSVLTRINSKCDEAPAVYACDLCTIEKYRFFQCGTINMLVPIDVHRCCGFLTSKSSIRLLKRYSWVRDSRDG